MKLLQLLATLIRSSKLFGFIISGGPGLLAYIVIFFPLESYNELPYRLVVAATLARTANSTVNFFVYKYVVYNNRSTTALQILPYIVLSLVLVILHTGALYIWDQMTYKSVVIAQFLLIYPQAKFSDYCLKRWVFNQKPTTK